MGERLARSQSESLRIDYFVFINLEENEVFRKVYYTKNRANLFAKAFKVHLLLRSNEDGRAPSAKPIRIAPN